MELYNLWCDMCNQTLPHYIQIKLSPAKAKSQHKKRIAIGITGTFVCLTCDKPYTNIKTEMQSQLYNDAPEEPF